MRHFYPCRDERLASRNRCIIWRICFVYLRVCAALCVVNLGQQDIVALGLALGAYAEPQYGSTLRNQLRRPIPTATAVVHRQVNTIGSLTVTLPPMGTLAKPRRPVAMAQPLLHAHFNKHMSGIWKSRADATNPNWYVYP
jgi:hypothetical protein